MVYLALTLIGSSASAESASPAERMESLEAALEAQAAEIESQSRRIEEQNRLLDEQRLRHGRQRRELQALREALSGDDLPPPVSEGPTVAEPDQEATQNEREGPIVPVPKPPVPRPPRIDDPPEVDDPAAPDEPMRPRRRAEPPPMAPAPPTETAEADAEDADPEAERPDSTKPLDQLLVEAGGILLPPGWLQVEPGFEFTYLSDSAVSIAGLQIFDAILIGTISVDRLDRQVYTHALTSRYGIARDIQIETRIPLVARRDREIIGVGTQDEFERESETFNLGDTELAVLWQPFKARDFLPDVILNLRGRFPTGESPFDIDQVRFTGDTGESVVRLDHPPTGNGFYGVTPGLTTVWRTDPAVLFFGGSYTANLERSFTGGFGRIDPGDQVSFSFGTNVSLSERLNLNLSFANTYTFATEQNGREVPGSQFNDGRLILGASLGLTPTSSMIVTVGAGLTEQSPDLQVVVRVPLTFALSPLFWD